MAPYDYHIYKAEYLYGAKSRQNSMSGSNSGLMHLFSSLLLSRLTKQLHPLSRCVCYIMLLEACIVWLFIF